MEEVEARRRALRKAHKRDRFGRVNFRNLFASDVDGEWSYEFKDFAGSNYDRSKTGFFGFGSSKLSLENMMSHSTKQLKQGLLKRTNESGEEGRKDAAQMSKNILSYMKDRKSSKGESGHVWKILRYAMERLVDPLKHMDDAEKLKSKKNMVKVGRFVSAAEVLSATNARSYSRKDNDDDKAPAETTYPVLWDEIFCILVKQTTDNKSVNKRGYPESIVKGFELFTLCAGTFKCTTGLYPYVMAHLDLAKKLKLFVAGEGEMRDEARKRVAILARRAQIRLQKTCQMEMRKKVPTELEFRAVLAAMPVMVRVYMMDGTFKTLPINTHTTAKSLSTMMALTVGVKQSDRYAIYEYDNADNNHYLHPTTRIMDVIAIWQEQVESMDDKQLARLRCSRLMFQVHYFLDIDEDDHIGQSILFLESVQNVVNQHYPASRRMCLDLAALQLQEELGDFTGEDDELMLKGNMHRYIPARFLAIDEDENGSLFDHLLRRWKKLKRNGYDQYECQLTYIEVLRQSVWYSSRLFKVKPMLGSDDYPPNGVWFAVTRDRIIVIDVESRDIIEHISIDQIVKHGCGHWSNHWGGTIVKLLAGNIVRQHAIRIVAIVPGEAEEMIDLIKVYQRAQNRRLENEPEDGSQTKASD